MYMEPSNGVFFLSVSLCFLVQSMSHVGAWGVLLRQQVREVKGSFYLKRGKAIASKRVGERTEKEIRASAKQEGDREDSLIASAMTAMTTAGWLFTLSCLLLAGEESRYLVQYRVVSDVFRAI